jgi:uracil-DNA glycosylase
LEAYLESRARAEIVLVGEAAGYRGARVSGIPFTSERQLTGAGPAEASATIVHRALGDLGLEEDVLLWNVVPTHPHEPGSPYTNRRPTRGEVESSSRFLDLVAGGRHVIAVGRLAECVTGAPYVRHPAHGGGAAFRDGLCRLLA